MTELDTNVDPHSRRGAQPPHELEVMRFHAERLVRLAERLQDNQTTESVDDAVARLLRLAEHRLPAVWTSYSTFPLVGELRELHRLESALLDGNPRARVMISRELAVEDVFTGPRSLHGVDVKVHDSSLPTMTVVDGLVALVAVDRGLTVLRDRAALRTVQAVLASVWEGAVDLRTVRRVELAWPEGSVQRRVLHLLSEGYTDEVAARRLDMSVRSYRRHVADLMVGLDTRSRFRAGLLAARLGLARDHTSASSSAPIAAE